jgi:hypothetical protein
MGHLCLKLAYLDFSAICFKKALEKMKNPMFECIIVEELMKIAYF